MQNSKMDTAQELLDEAKVSIAKGDPINAVAKLTMCLMADAAFADAYLTRCELLLTMGDADGAAEDAVWLTEHIGSTDILTALKTRIAAVYKERGRVKYAMGDTVGAERDMRRALQMDSGCMETVSGEYTAEGVEQKVTPVFGMAGARNAIQMGGKDCGECKKTVE